jgi:hypothetical protein
MLAPIVAVVPINDAGSCWSVQPSPLPIKGDGSLAGWVVGNVDNNIKALFLVGIAGLLVVAIAVTIVQRHAAAVVRMGDLGTRFGLLGTTLFLVIGLIAYNTWSHFNTDSHFIAGIAMFVFLGLAVGGNAWEHRSETPRAYFWTYTSIVTLMGLAAVALVAVSSGWAHMQLFLEGAEIALFGAFWLAQTKEHWHETAGASRART